MYLGSPSINGQIAWSLSVIADLLKTTPLNSSSGSLEDFMTPRHNDAWEMSNVESIISDPDTDATKPLSMPIQQLRNEANENVGYLKTSHTANFYY